MAVLAQKNQEGKGWRFAAPLSRFWLLPVIAASLLLSGCSDEVKVDQNFVDTFVELRLTEISYGNNSPMARLVRQGILRKAGYTRESYQAQMDKVLENDRQWVPFQKAVVARIDSLMAPPKVENANPGAAKPAPPKNSQMPSHKGGVQ